jgi:hypothetical protein
MNSKVPNKYAIIGGAVVWLGAGAFVNQTDMPFIPSLISLGGFVVFLFGITGWLMSKRKANTGA